MSLQRGASSSFVPGATPAYRLRRDWSFALAAAWQVAIALDARSRRSDLLRALHAFVALSVAPAASVVERSLLRGYLLDLARGLRAARHSAGAARTAELEAFCDCLEVPTTATQRLVPPARALMVHICERDQQFVMNTAEQARALIDQSGNGRLTTTALARLLGQNTRAIERAFRTTYGKTIAAYRREREAQAGLEAIARGLPLKRAVDFAGCSESTLRRRIRALTGRTPRGWKGRNPGRLSATSDA